MLPLTLFVLWTHVMTCVIFPVHYLSRQYFLFCALTAYLMRSSIHVQMSLGAFLAWAWFFSVLRVVVPPNMPGPWYFFWAGAIPAWWAVARPETSALRFFAWTAGLFAARFVVYMLYVWYWLNPFKSDLFPFSLVSGWCRAARSRCSPSPSPSPSGGDAGASLCRRCEGFISGSNLIMGSGFPVVRLVEWHDHHASVADFTSSVAPCRVCNLLLHSMSEGRRQRLMVVDMESPGPGVGGRFRVRVWEERPISSYTYVQLFKGREAVGARLLVHRRCRLQTDEGESACGPNSILR